MGKKNTFKKTFLALIAAFLLAFLIAVPSFASEIADNRGLFFSIKSIDDAGPKPVINASLTNTNGFKIDGLFLNSNVSQNSAEQGYSVNVVNNNGKSSLEPGESMDLLIELTSINQEPGGEEPGGEEPGGEEPGGEEPGGEEPGGEEPGGEEPGGEEPGENKPSTEDPVTPSTETYIYDDSLKNSENEIANDELLKKDNEDENVDTDADEKNADENETEEINVDESSRNSIEETSRVNESDRENNTDEKNPHTGVTQNVTAIGLSVIFVIIAFKNRKKLSKTGIKIIAVFTSASITLSIFSGTGTLLNVSAEDTGSFTVEKTVNIDGKPYVFNFIVSYDNSSFEDAVPELVDPTEEASAGVLSRGQWAVILTEILNINLEEYMNIALEDCFYSEIQLLLMTPETAEEEQLKTAVAAEILYRYGVLPAPEYETLPSAAVNEEMDLPLFNAGLPATREYVSYTAVQALGFIVNEQSETLSTGESFKYPKEALVSINQGIFRLSGGKFYPNGVVSSENIEIIKNKIKYLKDSVNITVDPNVEPEALYGFTEGVIDLSLAESEEMSYDVIETPEGYTVTIYNTPADIEITEGSTFLLPPNNIYPTGIAMKAISILKTGNILTVNGIAPEISDVYTDISYSGPLTPDISAIQYPDEYVNNISYDPNGMIGSDPNAHALDIKGEASGGTGMLSLSFNGENGITGSVKIGIPNITAKIDAHMGLFSGFQLNELLLKATTQLEFELALEVFEFEKDFLIAKVPVPLGPTGLSIDINFYLHIGADGKVSVTYTLENTAGIQYINGGLRTIKDYEETLDFNMLEISGEIGPKIGISLSALGFINIIQIDIDAGLGVTVSVNSNLCVDGAVYLYLKLGINDESLVGALLDDVLHLSIEYEIWDSNNSPANATLHFEYDVGLVSECTKDKGLINGLVTTFSNERMPNAKVTLLTSNGLTKAVAYTNQSGIYSFNNVSVGTYTVEVSKSGYEKASARNINVLSGQTAVVQTIKLPSRIDDPEERKGTLVSHVIDATKGADGFIPNASYTVWAGFDVRAESEQTPILSGTTDESGSFTANIDYGHYTVYITSDGFTSRYYNVSVTAGETTEITIPLNPTVSFGDDALRIILTWGEYPRDLDSHLYGPGAEGTEDFHTWYGGKSYHTYDSDGTQVIKAFLDVDDVTSYGPETTTVYSPMENGIYSFYVHDYSNGGSQSSNAMNLSDATVMVYRGDNLVMTCRIDPIMSSTLWYVFDFNSKTGEIIPKNEYLYNGVPGTNRPQNTPETGEDENDGHVFSFSVFDNTLKPENDTYFINVN